MSLMSSKSDQQAAAWFKALGHPVRVQIVRLLNEKGTCFGGDISSELPVAASTTSQHLKILKEAGIITGTIDGPRRCYCIRSEALDELKGWLQTI